MMRKFNYGVLQKWAFYTSYLTYKLLLPFELRAPRAGFLFYELRYTLSKFIDRTACLPWNSGPRKVTTRFGTFAVRPNTADASTVSPAFERRDLNHLFKLLTRLTDEGKRVLFLDIGANIGTYAVAVANRFRRKNVDIICYEPVPESFQLLQENIQTNQAEARAQLIKAALMESAQENLSIGMNAIAPGSSGITGKGEKVIVRAVRLDDSLEQQDRYDAIILKVDVEGSEQKVLEGGRNLLRSDLEVHLMAEDFIDRSIITYLEKSGWTFAGKFTEYNSWWYRKHENTDH